MNNNLKHSDIVANIIKIISLISWPLIIGLMNVKRLKDYKLLMSCVLLTNCRVMNKPICIQCFKCNIKNTLSRVLLQIGNYQKFVKWER